MVGVVVYLLPRDVNVTPIILPVESKSNVAVASYVESSPLIYISISDGKPTSLDVTVIESTYAFDISDVLS